METKTVLKGTEELRQFISFSVGAEEYGLELLRVKEVIRVREIAWLPKAPSFVKGIINLRDGVISIIDLRDRFGLESLDQTSHQGHRGRGGGPPDGHGGGLCKSGGENPR